MRGQPRVRQLFGVRQIAQRCHPEGGKECFGGDKSIGRCRVSLESDTRCGRRRLLPLDVRSFCRRAGAFPFPPGNLVDRSKQTGLLLVSKEQADPRTIAHADAEHCRLDRRT